ncbi:MAG: hypothetical protein K2Y71_19830 [Xanthobacteraceae bacterium]|nr:hypothetical protein [Xanthobacteraceae bacterium]
MPSEKSVSFRAHLLSNATDLLAEVDLHCARTAKLVVSIVSHLAAYTEEGTPLAPSVFICNSITQLVKRAGIGEHVPLSQLEDTETAAGKVLKICAPLCSSNWRIYVERSINGEHCHFGVFSGSTDPTALTVDEIVLDGFEAGFPIVRISQNVTNKVEVRTNSGSAIEFRFNDDLDVPDLHDRTHVRALSKVIGSTVGTQSESFSGFVERILAESVRDSHGTLIAVISDKDGALPEVLKDAVLLSPPLDLFERYRLHMDEESSVVSVGRLQTAAELVAGIVRSDGVTVFDTLGKVIAYRAFVPMEGQQVTATGGARTRAFVALQAFIGSGLEAIFFRSQDGRMAFKVAPKGHSNG